MSDLQTHDPNRGRRIAFRVAGAITALVAVVLIVVAVADLFGAMFDDSFDARPTKFWLAFVGIPLLAVGGWLLQAGFLGAASRYAATESAPGLRTAGEALGLRDDRTAASTSCSRCGRATDPAGRFCAGCGTPVA
jgi:hypothetical protein